MKHFQSYLFCISITNTPCNVDLFFLNYKPRLSSTGTRRHPWAPAAFGHKLFRFPSTNLPPVMNNWNTLDNKSCHRPLLLNCDFGPQGIPKPVKKKIIIKKDKLAAQKYCPFLNAFPVDISLSDPDCEGNLLYKNL